MSRKNVKNLIINWFILLTLPFWVVLGVFIKVVKDGVDKEAFILGERNLLKEYKDEVIFGE